MSRKKQPGKAQMDMALDIMQRIKCGEERNPIVVAMMTEYGYSHYIVQKCYREVQKKLLEIDARLSDDTDYNRRVLSGPVHERASRLHKRSLKKMDEGGEEAWGSAMRLSSSALGLELALGKWHHLEQIAPALELSSEPTREFLTTTLVRHFKAFSTVNILRILEAGQRELEARPDSVERTRCHMRNDRSFTRFLCNTYEAAQDLKHPPGWERPPDDETSH